MQRVPVMEKRRIADMLSRSSRPLQRIQDAQYPGSSNRRRAREVELMNTTAMERVLEFIMRLARASRLH